MIRHPFETIDSWKRSFPHLDQVDLDRFPFSGNDRLLDPFQRDSLAQISAATDLPIKRALLWKYLAGLVWRDRERTTTVRYEDLIDAPKKVLTTVSSVLDERSLATVSTGRVGRGASHPGLDSTEREITVAICGPLMARWGYGH